MSRTHNRQDPTHEPDAELRNIRAAKDRVDAAVELYTTEHLNGATEQSRATLHAAVINLHWKMRPTTMDTVFWTDLSDTDEWDQDIIWTGTHPQTGDQITLNGLQDLDWWIDNTTTTTTQRSGPHTTTTEQEQPLYLPAEAALATANILLYLFQKFGWGATKDEPRSLGRIPYEPDENE